MIEDFYRSFKPELIRVSLSTPFVTKARCRYCKGFPSYYYYARNPTLWYNPRRITESFKMMSKYIKRLSNDFHSAKNPRFCTKVSEIFHQVSYKGYRPRLHRTRGSNPTQDIVEYLMCECGRTSWGFTDKSIKGRPEILNKKAYQRFPQKFEF
jgi:hypothetical protein